MTSAKFFLQFSKRINNGSIVRRHLGTNSRIHPFKTLGIPVGSDFATVKRAFVKLALEKHPDHQGSDGSVQQFMAIREAYEAIRENFSRDGVAASDDDPSANWSPAELQEWFRKDTRSFLTFDMSDKTRREVIELYNNSADSRPLNDKGGYWEMARQLAEREENNNAAIKNGSSDEQPPLQLAKSSSFTGSARRRRRR